MARSEYAGMELSELEDKLVESRKELLNLRFQKATGQLDNTARIGAVKKDVARLLTVLRERELGIRDAELPLGASASHSSRRRGDAAAGPGAAGPDSQQEA